MTQGTEPEAFEWPNAVWAMVSVALITSVIAVWAWTNKSESHYQDLVRDALWTTYSIGNPSTVSLGNVRPSLEVPTALCGRINYERSANRGWSGYTDFFMEDGVVYISPANGMYWVRFTELCLLSGVDRSPD